MEKELWGKKFKIVKNGLDEKEVYAFIEQLIEPNEALVKKIDKVNSLLTSLSERHDYLVSKLTKSNASAPSSGTDNKKLDQLNDAINGINKKLDILSTIQLPKNASPKMISTGEIQTDPDKLAHLNSLIKLAESTIIEADNHAERIRAEIVGKAQVEATAIITEAQEKAHTILLRAKKMVEGEVIGMFDHAYQKLMSSIESREGIKSSYSAKPSIILETSTAGKNTDANSVPTNTAKVLNMSSSGPEIDSKVKATTYKVMQEVIEEYQDEVKCADDTADDKTEPEELINEQIEQESELDDAADEQDEEVSESNDATDEQDEEVSVSDDATDEHDEEVSESDNATGEHHEEVFKSDDTIEKKEDKTGSFQKACQDNPELYLGSIELVIPPPLGLDRVMQLHKDLKHIEDVEVLNFGGSVDKGITIKLITHVPKKLLDIIGKMNGVKSVVDEANVAPDLLPPPSHSNNTPIRRIVLTAEE